MTVNINAVNSETVSKETYEDVRLSFDHEIAQMYRDHKSNASVAYSTYLDMMKTALLKQRLKPREGEVVELELVRIAMYLEDSGLRELADEWLVESLDRNPKFYKSLYRHYNYKPEELELLQPKLEPKRPEYTPLFLEKKETPIEKVEVIPFDLDIFESEIAQSVDDLKNLRHKQIEEKMQEIMQSLLNSSLVSKPDVVATIAENKLLRQMLSLCLNKLGISLNTTRLGPEGVSSHTVEFSPLENSTLEQYKNGVAEAMPRIEEYKRSKLENNKFAAMFKKIEGEKQTVNKEASTLRSKVQSLTKEMEVWSSKPSLQDTKKLLFRIAWNDGGTRYYLGTNADESEKTDKGIYQIKTLIKSKNKKESIIFHSMDELKLQWERAITFYKKIDRGQLISLESLRSAYVLELLEFENEDVLKSTVVKNFN